jgi:hypothetical protein
VSKIRNFLYSIAFSLSVLKLTCGSSWYIFLNDFKNNQPVEITNPIMLLTIKPLAPVFAKPKAIYIPTIEMRCDTEPIAKSL